MSHKSSAMSGADEELLQNITVPEWKPAAKKGQKKVPYQVFPLQDE